MFFVWNGMQTPSSYYSTEDKVQDQEVSPEITQAILSKALTMKPDIVPIDTVFINPDKDDIYNARISFFNKKHFYGVQYDLKAKVTPDGSVNILSFGDSPKIDDSVGYLGGQFQKWQAVTDNLSAQFQGALQGYKKQPPQPNLTNVSVAYKSGMIESPTNLQTRS
jgi:hypothetical protein